MGGVKTLKVRDDEAGMRVDRWFKRRFPGLGHARVQKWLRTGQVRVDGGRVKAGARLQAGQQVRVPPLGLPAPQPGRRKPRISKADDRDLKARVLHRDDDVLVIDKPPGLAVQGGSGLGKHLDALLEALRFGARERPRLAHRLDKDTSGVLVLARNGAAARKLTAAFRSRQARKLYWAVVAGVPRPPEGIIDLALAKRLGRGGEKVGAGVAGGKRALTRYRVIDRAGRQAAWVAFEPETGRTHQLRVHAAAVETPILGDGKYGGREAFIAGQDTSRRLHLHAKALRIPHPAGGILEVSAPLPDHMRATFRTLGFDDRAEKDLFQ
ncbi:MAG: RNA pseudouridine synthase [Rhodospirillaceae bacterium]|jgi:23S rRNA pseudouridine955/2504/2580 synthase|nr:RNA pseudouridine synthase [Rhodospirillaceae bacterium]|tara:strand:- start:2376 stop:3347 length:972 start_codon:yes stop_codon:yes gene_type:complete